MPFERGNKLGEKSRKFEQLVERCLIQEDFKRLRAGIEKMLDECAKGERWALELVRDTLDGKPKQPIAIDLGVTPEERISTVASLITEAAGLEAHGGDTGLGEDRPMVSAEIPVTTH